MVGPAFLFDGIDDIVEIRKFTHIEPNAHYPRCLGLSDREAGYTTDTSSARTTKLERASISWRIEDPTISSTRFVWLPAGPITISCSTTTAQLNTWYHVAMTHDGLKLRLYVNGSLEGTLDAVGDIAPTSIPLESVGTSLRSSFKGSSTKLKSLTAL